MLFAKRTTNVIYIISLAWQRVITTSVSVEKQHGNEGCTWKAFIVLAKLYQRFGKSSKDRLVTRVSAALIKSEPQTTAICYTTSLSLEQPSDNNNNNLRW